MPDRESFVAAIAANPADDLPRLVFADWLEENGEGERAEFIRTQIRWHHATYESERNGLNRRAEELLDGCWEGWFHEFLRIIDPGSRPMHHSPRPGGNPAERVCFIPISTPDRSTYFDSVTLTRGFISQLGVYAGDQPDGAALAEAFRQEPVRTLVVHGGCTHPCGPRSPTPR